MRLDELYKKMEVMYRVLTRMYENSAILMEDVQDQVKVKEQFIDDLLAHRAAMQDLFRGGDTHCPRGAVRGLGCASSDSSHIVS